MPVDSPWRAAWQRAARIAPDAEWPPAPGVPLAPLADVGFDPLGRCALLVGYEAVHLLDLETMRSEVVVEDARIERSVRMGADGSRALVCDGYAGRVHVVELPAGHVTTRDDAPRKTWKALTRRLLRHGRADRDLAVRGDRRLRAEGAQAILTDPSGRHLLRAPAADGFGAVDRVGLAADGRPLVFARCRAGPASTDPAPTLCVYAAAPPFDLLGVVQLALRRAEPLLVFQGGRALPSEALGGVIQIQVRGQAQKALRRFAAPEDARTVERPFARTAEGLMGRLDADDPLGGEAVPHVERPADVRARLRGDPFAPRGADADALANYAQRVGFWTSRGPDGAFDALMGASRALTPLLPEIWRRAVNHGGPSRKRLVGASRSLAGAGDARRAAAFEDMCRWLRRVAAVGRLRGAPAPDAPTVDLIAATFHRDHLEPIRAVVEPDRDPAPLEAVAEAAASGVTDLTARGDLAVARALALGADPFAALARLTLQGDAFDDEAAAALADARLPALHTLVLAGTAVGDAGVAALARGAGLPALRHLDLRGTATTEAGVLALARSATLRALAAVELPAVVGALGRAALHLACGGARPLPPGVDRAVVRTLATHPQLPAAVRRAAIRWGLADPNSTDAALVFADGALGAGAGEVLGACPPEGLTDLTLGAQGLDAAGLRAMAPLLAGATLATLDLRGNALDDEALRWLAAHLPPGCRQVDVRANPAGQRGALALLAACLERGATLRVDPRAAGPAYSTAAAWLTPGADPPPPPAAEVLTTLLSSTDLPPAARATLADRAAAEAPAALGAALADLGAAGDPLLDRRAVVAAALAPTGDSLRACVAARWQRGGAREAQRLGPLVRSPGEPTTIRFATAPAFELRAEADLAALRKVFTGQDVLIGDAAFDRRAHVSGDPLAARATFDAPLRARLLRWLGEGLTLAGGVLQAPTRDVESLTDLLHVASALVPPDDLIARARVRLETEATPGVRQRLFEALDGRAAEAVVLEAAACIADDADAGVRASVGAALAPRLAADATLLESLSEGCLLSCLSLVEDELQRALIARLGAVGTERAVAPLTEVGGGLFTPAARRAAARAATDAIVKRIGGLRGGGLSVVEGDRRGGLSVPGADDD